MHTETCPFCSQSIRVGAMGRIIMHRVKNGANAGAICEGWMCLWELVKDYSRRTDGGKVTRL